MDKQKPECYNYYCTADPNLGMCIHCGAEMFEFEEQWFHHSQKDLDPETRIPQFITNLEDK